MKRLAIDGDVPRPADTQTTAAAGGVTGRASASGMFLGSWNDRGSTIKVPSLALTEAGLRQRSNLEDYQLLAPNMAKKLRKANGNARK
jgi:hypothetical protein